MKKEEIRNLIKNRIKLISEEIDIILLEDRTFTKTLEIAGNIGRMNDMKVLDIKGMSDGMIGLYRYEKDGNAYEIQIRPASLIKDKDMWGNILKSKEHPLKKNFKDLINTSI